MRSRRRMCRTLPCIFRLMSAPSPVVPLEDQERAAYSCWKTERKATTARASQTCTKIGHRTESLPPPPLGAAN